MTFGSNLAGQQIFLHESQRSQQDQTKLNYLFSASFLNMNGHQVLGGSWKLEKHRQRQTGRKKLEKEKQNKISKTKNSRKL